MNPVVNRVALITGGAVGIGRACAELLATEGAAVMITDRDVPGGQAAAAAIAAQGGRTDFMEHDVSLGYGRSIAR